MGAAQRAVRAGFARCPSLVAVVALVLAALPAPVRGQTLSYAIPVGDGPAGAVANSQTNRIYVTNYSGGTVSAIDDGSRTVVNTIPVGNHPNGIAVNPSTHRIYVANEADGSVSVIDELSSQVVATIPITDDIFRTR